VDKNAGKSVAEILEDKVGSIKNTPMPRGSPSWDDIMHLSWEEIVRRAVRRERGFGTFKKLLLDQRFDK
jgi:hypothetical protein